MHFCKEQGIVNELGVRFKTEKVRAGCCKVDADDVLLQSEAGRLPRPHNEEDALRLVALAENVNEAAKDKAELDADILKRVAYTAAGDLSPMAATLGGIVGQEVRS